MKTLDELKMERVALQTELDDIRSQNAIKKEQREIERLKKAIEKEKEVETL